MGIIISRMLSGKARRNWTPWWWRRWRSISCRRLAAWFPGRGRRPPRLLSTLLDWQPGTCSWDARKSYLTAKGSKALPPLTCSATATQWPFQRSR